MKIFFIPEVANGGEGGGGTEYKDKNYLFFS